jgi:F-type H+-transporting ATPase subunit c
MEANALAYFGAGIGAGLTIIGGALGIGRLAASALEGIARQPNAAGDIRGAMIVAAGLIEGVTFFALIVTILLAIKS